MAATVDFWQFAIKRSGDPDVPASISIAEFSISHPPVTTIPATIDIAGFSVSHPPTSIEITVAAGDDQDSIEPGATVSLSGTVTDPDEILDECGWEVEDITGADVSEIVFSGTGENQTFIAPPNLDGVTIRLRFYAIDIYGRTVEDFMRVGVMWSVETMMTASGLVPVEVMVMQ